MGFVVTVTSGLVLWIVLWALGIKAFDGILIVIGILVIAIVGRILGRYLPSRSAT